MQHDTNTRLGATVLGFPRIGRNRELKRSLEAYWSGRGDADDLDRTAYGVRLDALSTGSGLDTVPINTFSWYDHVLDTSVLLGVVPDRFRDIAGEHRLAGADAERYFAMARGTAEVPPLEMTKWFDTNYHYLVPEIGPETEFRLDAAKPIAEYAEAVRAGRAGRPVVVGPWTYLALAKPATGTDEDFDPLDRLDDLVPVYVELLGALAEHGVEWMQLDEPGLVRDLDDAQVARVREAYIRLSGVDHRPALLVATYFGNPVEALPALAETAVDGIALDLTRGISPGEVRDLPGIKEKALVLGVVDGRNVWRTDLWAALARLEEWRGVGRELAVSTSCSLLHVPYDAEVEDGLDGALRSNLAFADQKIAEVVALQRALDEGPESAEEAFAASDAAIAARPSIPHLSDPDVVSRTTAVEAAQRRRVPRSERTGPQAERLGLPPLPTTTIGSFPQTTRLRKARADRRAGRIDDTAYQEEMRREIREVVDLQTELGLDVLVHGEPERNDMVQYFAEQLLGYAHTVSGWVQSYGSRCVRPPILYGDVRRPEPMTVPWTTFAQGLTDKPMKGMLTGPVTMLAWSFVREDQPRAVTADQVALALRDEVVDLEAAGVAIVQVDEPALRETMPLRSADQTAYLDWAVGSFRLATAGVRPETQVHTHLCYSEFGEIVTAIDDLDADVTSIEAARSRMELLEDVRRLGFGGALGPGIYDIHSPRVPSQEEIAGLLRAALRSLPAESLWVNPDCGLKTRGYVEVTPALHAMVEAAHQIRAELDR